MGVCCGIVVGGAVVVPIIVLFVLLVWLQHRRCHCGCRCGGDVVDVMCRCCVRCQNKFVLLVVLQWFDVVVLCMCVCVCACMCACFESGCCVVSLM